MQATERLLSGAEHVAARAGCRSTRNVKQQLHPELSVLTPPIFKSRRPPRYPDYGTLASSKWPNRWKRPGELPSEEGGQTPLAQETHPFRLSTRSSITFATEPVTASLRHAISASAAAADSSRRGRPGAREDADLELDEVEIQKGLSQIGKGLQFLHESAKLVHSNLTPDAIIINAKVRPAVRSLGGGGGADARR